MLRFAFIHNIPLHLKTTHFFFQKVHLVQLHNNMVSFLELPCELRDMIYAYAADWSDITVHIWKLQSHLYRWSTSQPSDPKSCLPQDSQLDLPIPDDVWRSYLPKLTTPTVLLLSRQIHAEAYAILRNKPLVLSHPIPTIRDPSNWETPLETSITHFITPFSLRKVSRMELHLSHVDATTLPYVASSSDAEWGGFVCPGGKRVAPNQWWYH